MGTERGLAVVTGASSGLGATFCRRLAARGYHLWLVARRRDRLEALAAELASTHGVNAEPVPADLSLEQDVESLALRLESASNLELLINNAGFGTKRRFHETDLGPQIDMHRVHVLATLRLMRAALPGMVARNSGGIINVSSLAAMARSPGNVSYCATKAWMNAFTEGIYLELRSIGSDVRVQALCPGYIFTEFHDVLGVDRSLIARSWWMSAESVVEESLRELERGKLFVVPGWRYKLVAAVVPKLPVAVRLAVEQRSPHPRGRV